ncbi:MAG: hypothetical protein C0601_07775 [Candidatus Muiribacterium halophilum]|uniref:DRTGG domain-containing protein n=1 Tax=Muiribacterium halophilum TaxID=2053465 RepID=A0A2N5ZFN6_MUIH1|nr:MAG: hypothetical protein C0601_07775 [Candidatus Muirbacterium halophilum]
MNVDDLAKLIDAKVICRGEECEIKEFCCTDLMSDVLAYTHEGECTALITALSNAQALRTAEMVDIKTVIIVRGKAIEKKLVDIAADNEITLLSTELSMFDVAGKIKETLDLQKEKAKNA